MLSKNPQSLKGFKLYGLIYKIFSVTKYVCVEADQQLPGVMDDEQGGNGCDHNKTG